MGRNDRDKDWHKEAHSSCPDALIHTNTLKACSTKAYYSGAGRDSLRRVRDAPIICGKIGHMTLLKFLLKGIIKREMSGRH